MLFKVCLNLLVRALSNVFASPELHIFAIHCDFCFTNLNVLFDVTLGNFYVTSLTIDLYFIVKLHDNPVRLFHFRCSLAVRTCNGSLNFLSALPGLYTLVTEKFLTGLALFRVSYDLHTNDTIELIFNF